MRYKAYPIQIWFLDDDLCMSAQYLSNKYLNATINGCFNALVSSRMYYIGIRSVKFYKYYFSKERVFETTDKFFPSWPLPYAPKFKSYDTKTTKWCRMCKEHYDYVKQYLTYCLGEYEYRFGKQHQLDKFLEWDQFDAPTIPIKNANLKKLVLPWKCLNPKYRKKDIVEGYRLQYKHLIKDPFGEYSTTRRDIPSWLLDNYMI